MGIFDNYNYEINRRLPEFWKSDTFLKPIERVSSFIMKDTVQRFMEKMGVMQPFMVWKTLPEEYYWEYGFEDYDMRLANEEENPNCNQTLMLAYGNHIVAQLPLTKRDVNAYIVIDLSSTSFSDVTEYTEIKELIIKNADQTLKIKDIDSKTIIEIYTESNTILINDSVPKAGQIEGSLDIIKREPRESIKNITDPLDINEKCELEIYINGDEKAYCDLYIKLDYPVYVTEQNIRVSTISAFPLEYVRLYGYMCHKYNYNHQWVYLWEKTYGYEDRIVYDKIAKQYDCEIFYAEIKLYGLPAPIYIGFPATEADSTEGVFSLNQSLDYWGDIFHIPRRQYRTDILESEERFCFPKYYNYSVEQDYPYEQRLINEYKYNEDWSDYVNITDTEGNDIALVKCKDPYIENIYMYTETIPPTSLLNSKSVFNPNCITEINQNNDDLKRATWSNVKNCASESNSYTITTLNNQDEDNVTDKSYQANVLSMEFDLTSLPENCKIQGMELKFKGVSNTHSDNIYIDERSFLKYTQKIKNDETGNHKYQAREIPLSSYFNEWNPDNASYILGYRDSIFFGEDFIDRDSIEYGYIKNGIPQSNKVRFDIGFSNKNSYLDLIIKLFNIQLIVYFDLIKENIDVSVNVPNRFIVCDNNLEQASCINVNLNFNNTGEIKEIDYDAFVILPKELCFVEYNSQTETYERINNQSIKKIRLGDKVNNEYNELHISEIWDIDLKISANQVPEFKTGKYDILVICGDKIVKQEVYIYNEDYIQNNGLASNIIYDENKTILTFNTEFIDAINGQINDLTLSLQDNQGEPIPYQYVKIQINNQESYHILDNNGKLILASENNPLDISENTLIKATYGNITASCYIYSLGLNINIFKYLKKQYHISKTDDLNMLRWVLLKTDTIDDNILSNQDILYIVEQLESNQLISQELLQSMTLIRSSYNINVSQDNITRHDNYILVYTTNLIALNQEKEETRFNTTDILVFEDINDYITNDNIFDKNISTLVQLPTIIELVFDNNEYNAVDGSCSITCTLKTRGIVETLNDNNIILTGSDDSSYIEPLNDNNQCTFNLWGEGDITYTATYDNVSASCIVYGMNNKLEITDITCQSRVTSSYSSNNTRYVTKKFTWTVKDDNGDPVPDVYGHFVYRRKNTHITNAQYEYIRLAARKTNKDGQATYSITMPSYITTACTSGDATHRPSVEGNWKYESYIA